MKNLYSKKHWLQCYLKRKLAVHFNNVNQDGQRNAYRTTQHPGILKNSSS